MSTEFVCYNCNQSLATLSLPVSRRDMCPSCSVHLHACRMCVAFDVNVIGQCREEDAEDVRDKERVNFCEWFDPASGAFDANRQTEHVRAAAELNSLFGEDSADNQPGSGNVLAANAEKLFK